VKSGRLDFVELFSTPISVFHLFGLLALLVNMILQALRWWWLTKAQKIELSLGQAVQLSWIGQFFSLVLLGSAGGDLIRAYYVSRDASVTKVASVSTVLLDRVLGLYAVLWLGVPSLIVLVVLQNKTTLAIIQMGGVIALLVVGTSVVFLALWIHLTRNLVLNLMPNRFRGSLEGTLNAYQAHGRDLLACFALSLLANVVLMGVFLLAGRVVGASLGWSQVLLVVPLVIIANSLPISPGGIGVAETTASVLFAQFGIEAGAAIMLIVRLWTMILRLPGGLIFVLRTPGSVTRLVGDAKPPSPVKEVGQ
jgi:uncharacterized protein (TIRG00374 family)